MLIMVLEDETQRMDVIKKWLKKIFPKDDLEILIVSSVASAKKLLKKHLLFDIILLDHDLGHPDQTGYDVAVFIKQNNVQYKKCIVHSLNPVGIQNIIAIIKDAIILPFTNMLKLVKGV